VNVFVAEDAGYPIEKVEVGKGPARSCEMARFCVLDAASTSALFAWQKYVG
jgi:hypothetical protein